MDSGTVKEINYTISRFKDYWGCIEWLNDARMINICYCLHTPDLPLKGNYEDAKYKIYFKDPMRCCVRCYFFQGLHTVTKCGRIEKANIIKAAPVRCRCFFSAHASVNKT